MLSENPATENPATESPAIESPAIESPAIESPVKLGRRAFLKNGALLLVGSTSAASLATIATGAPRHKADDETTIGLITDLHYADKKVSGSRHYRETPTKLKEAAEYFAKHNLNFLVELGDLIDAADTVEAEMKFLTTIDQQLAPICKNRHYVLGNHCVTTLTKAEFLGQVGQKKSYYSFDQNGTHFLVLDSCFRSDGEPYGRKNFTWTDPNVPQDELDWLSEDLKTTDKPTVVFAHQRLDEANNHRVKNAPAVRKILESSGNVQAVFQGHSHKNEYQEIGGIHYCTLVAMVEGHGATNSGYSILTISQDGSLKLDGFRNQKDYSWE